MSRRRLAIDCVRFRHHASSSRLSLLLHPGEVRGKVSTSLPRHARSGEVGSTSFLEIRSDQGKHRVLHSLVVQLVQLAQVASLQHIDWHVEGGLPLMTQL